MLRAFVLHDEGDLHDEVPRGGELQAFHKAGIIELIGMVVGMEPDAAHAVEFRAAAKTEPRQRLHG